ncbi:MAG TPA: pirin family protein [Polyangiaceae bacterium]|nr:pirin family protein [Polyangiaceae bacterium]
MLGIIDATETRDGADARLFQVLPSASGADLDPLGYFVEFDFSAPAGFPDHGHSGFEGVTYMFTGALHHRDSLGHEGEITAGSAQRFTAGRGIVHSEMPAGNSPAHGLQLWVNLPRALKGVAPDWQQVESVALPYESSAGVEVHRILGGNSPLRLLTRAEMWDVQLAQGASFKQASAGASWRTVVYVVDGIVAYGEHSLHRRQAALLGAGQLTLVAPAPGTARVVVFQGLAHGEPIRHRGGSLE